MTDSSEIRMGTRSELSDFEVTTPTFRVDSAELTFVVVHEGGGVLLEMVQSSCLNKTGHFVAHILLSSLLKT